MTQTKLYPTWQDIITFGTHGPDHQELIETNTYKAVLVGLEAGQKIPPHPAAAAAYHFLEGSGWMIVDGERIAIETGATLVVPDGVSRGVDADTRLAFLGSHAISATKAMGPTSLRKFGLVGLIGLILMLALMAVFGLVMGGMPALIMNSGLGMWGVMAIPIVMLLLMIVGMFFFSRWMMSGGGPMALMAGHKNTHSSAIEPTSASSITYDVPSVHCAHCKMKVEREISGLPGVADVCVDLDAKQVTIKYDAPANEIQLEDRLIEIGYPPVSE